MRKSKLLLWFTAVITLFVSLFTGGLVYAQNQTEDNGYVLNFGITRKAMTTYDYPNGAYANYWMTQPENDIFDHENWNLRDFTVDFELHIDGQSETLIKQMSYTSEDYTWHGDISFENINIPYERVDMEYYGSEDGNDIEPYLLHYDLYLKKSDGKMILSVPRLKLNEGYVTDPVNGKKALLVTDMNVTSKNPYIKEIYLDGQSGNDSNDGTTPEKAVKTFEKAKELSLTNPTIKNIIVVGRTEINGDISLKGTNAKIIRGARFNGYLFSVESGNAVTLSDVIIDGNTENNKNIENSLISVKSGAKINISSGAILRNNKIKDIVNTSTNGGAMNAVRATVNMDGGIIEGNQATYGGGVYLYGSVMNFTDGVIQNNYSKRVTDRSTVPSQFYSAGGGVLADQGSTINMSGNAKVINNYSNEIGGGISLGSNQWGDGNVLNMNGGTVEGNTAGSSGGGIFIQAKYYFGGVSKAYIYGGNIINNKMDATGYTENSFGGGGIYVNGANDMYGVNGANGELYLKNVIITDNTSKSDGAGYAACPISKTKIYITDGAAIYGNHRGNEGSEIFILQSNYFGLHSGNPEYEISKRMLGGVSYNWKNSDNSYLKEEDHKGTLENNNYLLLHTDETGNELTYRLGKVIISGNVSETRGAGIGSNGTVTIGTPEEITDIAAEKIWNDENASDNRPESVSVTLTGTVGGKEYDIQTERLSADSGWKTEFKDLPVTANGENIIYSVKEEHVNGYVGTISGDQHDGFKITNSPVDDKTDIKVTKIWEDDNNRSGKRPDSVDVQLVADGEDVNGKIITLNEDNNWTGSFTNLEKYNNKNEEITYTVREVNISEDYEEIISGSAESGYLITNRMRPEIPPETPDSPPETPGETPDIPLKEQNNGSSPKTGDALNVLPYFVVLGIAIISTAIIYSVKNKHKR